MELFIYVPMLMAALGSIGIVAARNWRWFWLCFALGVIPALTAGVIARALPGYPGENNSMIVGVLVEVLLAGAVILVALLKSLYFIISRLLKRRRA